VSNLYLLRPNVEVGGKLAIRNVAEVKAQLQRWLSLGFRKAQLLCFVQHDGRATLLNIVAFCREHIGTEPDLVGWIRDEGKRIKSDRDMVFVRVDDAKTRSYTVGILDQPKRKVLSVPMRHKLGLH
jgi:hypothetical protein